jgi:hypothetical protein
VNPHGGYYITFAELKVNGTVVKTYTAADVTPMTVAVAAIFDSTHFAPNSTVTVTLDATEATVGFPLLINTWHADGTAPVKNKNVSYQHPIGNSIQLIDGKLSNAKWEKTMVSNSTWTPSNMFSNMTRVSIYSYSGHGIIPPWGAYDSILSGDDQAWIPPYPISGVLYDNFEYNAQQRVGGPDLPPYNQTHEPATSFGYFDCCWIGRHNNFIRLCWPYSDVYGNWIDVSGRSIFAYTLRIAAGVSETNRVTVVYDSLTSEHTVWQARKSEIDEAANGLPMTVVEDPPASISRQLTNGDVAIYGDIYTRITGVYTGSNTPSPTGWYYPL